MTNKLKRTRLAQDVGYVFLTHVVIDPVETVIAMSRVIRSSVL